MSKLIHSLSFHLAGAITDDISEQIILELFQVFWVIDVYGYHWWTLTDQVLHSVLVRDKEVLLFVKLE